MDNGASSYRRFLNGDKNAFDEILNLYRESLIFFIHRFVHNLDTAEDLAADSFAELLVNPKRFNFSCSLKTYLFTIGRSRAIDYLRSAAHRKNVPLDDTAAQKADLESLEETVIKSDRKRRLNKAIEGLKEDYRTAIHLVYFEELSYEEAGRVMKKSKKQVENLLYRAKKALRTELEKEGFEL